MFKILPLFFLLLQTPASFAKDNIEITFGSPEEEFVDAANVDTREMPFVFDQFLEHRTRVLYQTFTKAAEVADEQTDIEILTEASARDFAQALRVWMRTVSDRTEGIFYGRLRQQRQYGEKVMQRLVLSHPFKSKYAHEIFYSTLYEEMNHIENGLITEAMNLKIAEEEARPKGLQVKAFLTNVFIGGLVNYDLTSYPLLHVDSGMAKVIGLAIFATGYILAITKWGETREMNTLRVALRYTQELRCERLLESPTLVELDYPSDDL